MDRDKHLMGLFYSNRVMTVVSYLFYKGKGVFLSSLTRYAMQTAFEVWIGVMVHRKTLD